MRGLYRGLSVLLYGSIPKSAVRSVITLSPSVCLSVCVSVCLLSLSVRMMFFCMTQSPSHCQVSPCLSIFLVCLPLSLTYTHYYLSVCLSPLSHTHTRTVALFLGLLSHPLTAFLFSPFCCEFTVPPIFLQFLSCCCHHTS